MTRFGYACISQLTGLTTNHNCQLKAATPDKLRGLIARNLEDLAAILRHNQEHGWRCFRVGSSVIPFGSHPVNTLRWWEEFAEPLAALGRFVLAHGMRLSMHPGQYTVLNSPNEAVRVSSLAELVYATRFLDALGLDGQHKVVLHIGGVYGDKPAAAKRFIAAAKTLPDRVRRRLVIEHDERGYNLAEVVEIAHQTRLPVVFDHLHDRLYPSLLPARALLPEVFATWKAADGPPKVHFSSQAVGGRFGAHADMADPVEFRAVLDLCRQFGDFDLMLEAKAKDAALRAVLAASDVSSYLNLSHQAG
ncbi:MAG TPA: UV DNA damage repair endonuclease UvsE [Phototrophicaceae bacterium]|nr:UV DNA damage repair endonuclease UvsE [Phototrophicaceae bacterium]